MKIFNKYFTGSDDGMYKNRQSAIARAIEILPIYTINIDELSAIEIPTAFFGIDTNCILAVTCKDFTYYFMFDENLMNPLVIDGILAFQENSEPVKETGFYFRIEILKNNFLNVKIFKHTTQGTPHEKDIEALRRYIINTVLRFSTMQHKNPKKAH